MAEPLPLDATITFLRVAELERSARFYGDGLGLGLVVDQGSCRIYRLTESAFLGLCERADPGSTGVIVTIVTDDVIGWHDRLVAAGAEVDGPPRDNPAYRILHCFARDPDGHLLEVQQFWDEGWDQPLG